MGHSPTDEELFAIVHEVSSYECDLFFFLWEQGLLADHVSPTAAARVETAVEGPQCSAAAVEVQQQRSAHAPPAAAAALSGGFALLLFGYVAVAFVGQHVLVRQHHNPRVLLVAGG
jgi:hypothetical protein